MVEKMTVPPSSQFVTVVESIEVKKKGVATWCALNWKPILAEFVSTMFLLLLGCMSCIPIDGISPHPPMYSPFGFGLMVLFNIQSFGHISGAHMNPSVTFTAVLWGKMSIVLGIAYVIAQCLGAIAGYGILLGVTPVEMVADGVCTTQPHPNHYIYQALIIEIFLSAALGFINCAVWDPVNDDKQDSNPIKFGLTIAGLSIVGGPLTGASMNPARSFAPALWTWTWNGHWIYWVGPMIGGGLAGLLYKYVWLGKSEAKDFEVQRLNERL
ncbi:aquaporin-like [Epargyreus clarus]|uniref:aquaporin-like n=1 Tax=Epargyreus clarus TaxID=520877 RepID=UPI003C2E8CA8